MASKKAPSATTTTTTIEKNEDWGETQPIAQREQAKAKVKGEKLIDDGNTALTTAKQTTIKTADDYTSVIEELKKVRTVRAEIDATFDPIIKSAHQTHKEALAQKKRVDTPWMEADTFLTRLAGTYTREQEQLRLAEERKIREENEVRILAAGEEERLRVATELSERGDLDGAAEAMDAPIAVPMVSVRVESTVPKVDGVSNRKNYHAYVLDKRKLLASVLAGTAPWEAIEANMTFLNAQARTFKREGEIYPGVVGVMEMGTGVTL